MDMSMKILVADDFATMRRVIKQLLGELGFCEVAEASDGAAAWQMLQDGEFGLLISDWEMPAMDGLDLVKAVRGDPELAWLPVLLVTENAAREPLTQAARCGVNGYIVKPFTAATLKQKIDRIFSRLARAA